MARKIRVWYPGAIYHITARGNRQANLFYDDKDRFKYLTLLEEAREKYPFILHAYCLMSNHIHFLLETKESPAGPIIKRIHSPYAMYFNKRHDLVGHVFQGRYGSEMINSTDYFLKVSRYIHLNPVEADIVKQADEYKWSSCHAYTSQKVNPHISTVKVLSHLPPQTDYSQYLADGGLTPCSMLSNLL